jgi:hypothetical protein
MVTLGSSWIRRAGLAGLANHENAVVTPQKLHHPHKARSGQILHHNSSTISSRETFHLPINQLIH